MIVALCENGSRWPEVFWERTLGMLPPESRTALKRYRRWQDRQASVLGRLLLGTCSRRVLGEVPDLGELAVDDYRRPYFPGLAQFDFNISHTEGLVACAAARACGRVGVDVERVGEIDLREFRRVFTPEEYTYLTGLENPREEFYRFWTRKEAVMKADGRGFYLDPSLIDCRGESISIDGKEFPVRQLTLPEGFAGHLSGGEGEPEVIRIGWEEAAAVFEAG
ncbi:4'-phosphopantetheinyl transferase family protein [Lewinella sp. IMCC34183]|uniref:4'-phosphopantetheinyl transferase family protein n=1 Tax=Lewinella sp. IMCC34183 TaxID=2248762 RepID=UPI000E249DB6|nr:4'-phosphopantetheinyl transferase superfamily protein [Lewinella sp. IMCC34183]